jgi:uncharacterized protein (TIGR02246 family)
MSGGGVEDVVQRQVEAYNAHDLDGFCACYSQDVVVLDADGNEMLRGMEPFREQYRQLFEGDAVAEIVARVSAGRWVVDHEMVRLADGLAGGA